MTSVRARLANADALFIAATVIAFGLVTGAFTGPVKGYDGWGHLTKVVLVWKDFPAIDWNPYWYSGSPFFLGGYPPLFYMAGAALTWLGLGGTVAMNLLMGLSYVAIVLSLYGLVRLLTGSRLGAVVTALLLVATPMFWTPYVQAGLYTRVFGMAFASAAIYLAVLYLRRPSRLRFALLMAAVWAAMSSHVVLAAVAVLSVTLVLMSVPDQAGRARWTRGLLIAPAVLLAAYYYVPLVFYGQSGAEQTAGYPPVGYTDVLLGLTPVLPATALVVSIALLLRTRADVAGTRAISALLVVVLLMVFYALAPLPRVAGLRSIDMLFFLAWFVAAIGGLVLGSIRLSVPAGQRQGAVATALVAALTLVVIAAPAVTSAAVRNPAQPQEVVAGWHPPGVSAGLYRVASPSDNLSVWLNAVYDVPQTRGYAAIPQVLNPDWQYWLDNTAWSASAGDAQRRFIFDWYAVRWIYVPSSYMPATAGVLPVLNERPDLYSPLTPGNGGATTTFEYLDSSPIAVATTAPTVLFVGDPSDYRTFFRALSYSAFDSSRAVTIEGSPYIDDVSAAALRRFDEVVLVGARAHDAARARSLLAGYVTAGGGLIIEGDTGSSVSLGVTATSAFQLNGDWRFRSGPNPISTAIDYSAFAAPSYKGGPWTVAAATRFEPWAVPVLWSDDRPVFATGQLGAGRVVWSGLNLPFHIDTYHNPEESRFLTSAMAWAAGSIAGSNLAPSARWDDPEQLTVRVDLASTGVLFKESYFDRWHAYFNGADATIYRAGPGFMYVMLPAGTRLPATVTFRYDRDIFDWAGLATSAGTLVALITWPRWSGVARRLRDRIRAQWAE